jgi:hypothetical protein
MPKKGKMVKKTRAKAKNVTQTVIVNVGKRGGGKSATAPPVRSAPTPLQQALQLLQTQRQPPQGESLIQSTQILQRMIEPINRRLEVLMRQPSQVPAINITQPPINIAQPAISVTQPPINVSQPAINISSMQPQALPLVKPQASMASQTEAPQIQAPLVQGIKPFQPYQLPQTPLSYRDYVLDLPDAPLVEPAKPLVPGGSLRLDPEHEDVPIVRPVVEEKEEEKYEEEEWSPPPPNYDDLLEEIDNSVGAEGNKKREPGQYTKKELIDMVTNTTGRTFAPSMSNSYNRIKQIAISFIKDIMKSK